MPLNKNKSVLKQFNFILCCFLVLGIGLFLLSYNVIYGLMIKNASSYAKSTAEKFESEVDFLIKRADTIFTSLLFDNNIENLMLSPFSSKTPEYIKSLQTQFSSYSIMNNDISDIALFSDELVWSNYCDRASLQKFSDEMKESYGSRCFGLKSSPFFSLREKNSYRLIFGHNMYGMHNRANYGKLLGTLFLSLDLNKSNLILPDNKKEFTYFILVDDNGNSFSFNGKKVIKDEILSELGESSEKAGSKLIFLETPNYLIYKSRISDKPLTVITALDKHSITAEVRFTTFVIISVTLLSLTIIALLMRSILRNIVTPLKKLSIHIENLKEISPVSDKAPVKLTGCSEIVSLSNSFNNMLERQNELSLELQAATVNLYEMELEKKKAELSFLRSQINPHFLYNSLESIASLSLEKSVPEISDAISALGKLFRYNIKGESIVPFEKELEMIQSYLTICKIRFPKKLNIIYSIRNDTKEIPVMKFILQPFAENALKHSVEPGTSPVTIYIGAKLNETHLVISIYDDGTGIPAETLSKLKDMLASPLSFKDDENRSHIGIFNVAKRLALYYGDDCNIDLDSTPGNGTRIVIFIPKS